MTARDVFRYDLRRLRRSRTAAAAALVYAALVGFVVVTQSRDDQVDQILIIVASGSVVLLPLLALSLSVLSVAGERGDETARLQLGLPNGRRQFVLGKLASRLVAVVSIVSLTAVGSSAVLLSTNGVVWTRIVAVFWLLVLGLAVTYTCIGVGVSAATRSKGSAAGAGLGVYFLSVFTWSPLSFLSIPDLGQTVLGEFVTLPPGTFLVVEALSPATAFLRALELAAARTMPIRPAPDTATLLQPPVMVSILFVWCCGAVVVGVRRFERAELE